MDYGIENTTHDKAYFDKIDKEAEKEIWLETRTAEIASQIVADEHPLYSVSNCFAADILNDEGFLFDVDQLNNALIACIGGLQIGLVSIGYLAKLSVEKQARILAEGELAAMENEDDF